ncbi:MAG: DUF655 domain-containing protein [Nanoarchaeota archaeon]
MESKEEHAIILDFLPNGYPFDKRPSHKKTPVAQGLGKTKLSLLELAPKPGVHLQPYEEVYIGEGLRDKVQHVLGRLDPDRLTHTARTELDFAVKDLIDKNEARFIGFYNNSRPLTIRMHQLELLPGVGKKHMKEILEAREERPFSSFDDMRSRVKLLPDPKGLIVRRIVNEILGQEKHRLFVEGIY